MILYQDISPKETLKASVSDQIVLPSLVYLETSAATGQNVAHAVEVLLDRVMRRMETTVDKSLLPHQKVLRCHERDTPPPSTSCYC